MGNAAEIAREADAIALSIFSLGELAWSRKKDGNGGDASGTAKWRIWPLHSGGKWLTLEVLGGEKKKKRWGGNAMPRTRELGRE